MDLRTPNHEKIAEANDAFRKKVIREPHPNGRALMTRGVAALDASSQAAVLNAVRDQSEFEEGNDPYGEHDFGCVTPYGIKVYWKIDYFEDASMEFGAPDKDKVDNCYRKLTIMLAEEY